MADDIRRTPMYDELLASAERIARERGDDYVSVEHVAIAMFADAESVPAIELRHRMGVNVDELVRRLGWYLDEPKPGPGEYGVRRLDGSVSIHPADDPSTTLARWAPPRAS
ncbi:Clp protease N-terminal domain-containing protein [Nocardia sp. NPDC050630]|uniref:Clp protease N-terminal domain-containing protein n=1 Tax=Nocardia sp. NPDC050630 TaxID=3364321 RepID=UPI0037B91ADC